MKQFLMQAYSQLALLCTFFYNTKHCDIKAEWWLFVSLTAGIGMDTLLSSYVRHAQMIMRITDKTLSGKVAKTTTEYAERAVEQNVWSETGERR